nr:hypothetical protein [Kibdelosporangium sp. MJ126-NF4]CTQ99334.1 hypothetical protein [Kibdelosporangium sp. MJ126-NF4]
MQTHRGEHRVERGQTGDHGELDRDHQHEPGRPRADEPQTDQPHHPRGAEAQQDRAVTEPADQRPRHPRAEQPAQTRDAQRQAVFPRCETQFAHHPEQQQRPGRHDQRVREHRVGQHQPQPGVAEDHPPPFGEPPGLVVHDRWSRFRRLDHADSQCGQQEAGSVEHGGDHRAEYADQRAAQWRADGGGDPQDVLEPAVGRQQLFPGDQAFQVRSAGADEDDVGQCDHDRHREQVVVGQRVQRVRGWNRGQHDETQEIRVDHQRAFAPELHPWSQRQGEQRADCQAGRRDQRHLEGADVQRLDRDQRKGVQRQICPQCAGRVRPPQPREVSSHAGIQPVPSDSRGRRPRIDQESRAVVARRWATVHDPSIQDGHPADRSIAAVLMRNEGHRQCPRQPPSTTSSCPEQV